jgi:hypothetical protein
VVKRLETGSETEVVGGRMDAIGSAVSMESQVSAGESKGERLEMPDGDRDAG